VQSGALAMKTKEMGPQKAAPQSLKSVSRPLASQSCPKQQVLRGVRLQAIVAEANSPDPWTSRARPSFLYVMYVLLLTAIPMGVLSAFDPAAARDIAAGMNDYLTGLPEPLYALFGTGYLGYTAARQWGKIKGVDR